MKKEKKVKHNFKWELTEMYDGTLFFHLYERHISKCKCGNNQVIYTNRKTRRYRSEIVNKVLPVKSMSEFEVIRERE